MAPLRAHRSALIAAGARAATVDALIAAAQREACEGMGREVARVIRAAVESFENEEPAVARPPPDVPPPRPANDDEPPWRRAIAWLRECVD